MSKSAPTIPSSDLPLGKRLAVLVATNRAIEAATFESVIRCFDSSKMQLLLHYTNDIVRARNVLAQQFLDSGCEWSFWVDDDMILPCGDAALFKRLCNCPNLHDSYAGLNAIGKLHQRQKTLVGGAYFGRFKGSPLQAWAPSVDASQIAKLQGPTDAIVPVTWVATGCMLVHRSVYTDILDKKLAPTVEASLQLGYKHGFFSPIQPGMGEDVSFCHRAKAAGHQPWLDYAVQPGHVGKAVYNHLT